MLLRAMEKLLEKYLLTYAMTRNLSCVDPGMMAPKKEDYVVKFDRVLSKDGGHEPGTRARSDSITREHRTFLDEVGAKNHTTFKEFRCDAEHVDTVLSV